jgi:hypothetical protein
MRNRMILSYRLDTMVSDILGMTWSISMLMDSLGASFLIVFGLIDRHGSSITGDECTSSPYIWYSGPACSRQQNIYQSGDQRANGGKASTKDSTNGQASGGEEAKMLLIVIKHQI